MTKRMPRSKAPDYDGSTPLSGIREEAYCQNIVSGRYQSRQEAHVAAGFAKHKGNEQRTFNRPDVQKRIRWLQAQVTERTVVDRAYVLARLQENAERCMEKGDERNPAAANKALELLGKEIGMFVDRRINFEKSLDKMTEDELRALLGMSAEELEALIAGRRGS